MRANVVEVLIAELEAKGARFVPRGDLLHVDAPAGVLTSQVVRSLRSCKPAVLAVLKVRRVLNSRRLQGAELRRLTKLNRRALSQALGTLYVAGELRSDTEGHYWLAKPTVH